MGDRRSEEGPPAPDEREGDVERGVPSRPDEPVHPDTPPPPD